MWNLNRAACVDGMCVCVCACACALACQGEHLRPESRLHCWLVCGQPRQVAPVKLVKHLGLHKREDHNKPCMCSNTLCSSSYPWQLAITLCLSVPRSAMSWQRYPRVRYLVERELEMGCPLLSSCEQMRC